MKTIESARKNFEKHYLGEPNSGCWLWDGGYGGSGRTRHGVFSYLGRQTQAHRASYMLHVGPIPAGLFICHKCDVPICVNPTHLYAGTHADNMRDARERNRFWRGEQFGKALTTEKVRAIRVDNRSQRRIAADYGIDQKTVCDVKRRLIWQHIDPPYVPDRLAREAAKRLGIKDPLQERLMLAASQKIAEQRAEIASLEQRVADLTAILRRAQNSIGASMGPESSQDPMEALEAVEAILEGRV